MNARPAFATFLVLWVVAIAAVVIATIQTTAFSESVAGRESLARVRAYWAARAGLEATIARLEYATENPETSDAFAVVEDMIDVAEGSLAGAAYRVWYTEAGVTVLGPIDAHARLNINRMNAASLLTLPFMTEDTADAILDWIDADDDTRPLGAEIGYYQSLPYPYEPRNGPIRSLEELELVAGVYPEFVRGEDWNLNGILDPNEDDGDASLPYDNADGKLDAGWSAIITCLSVDDVLSPSGQERLDLRTASEGDIAQRIGVDSEQAKAIYDYIAAAQSPTMRNFIVNDLRQLVNSMTSGGGGGRGGGGGGSNVAPLDRDQLALLLDECVIDADTSTGPKPGRLNINTCPAETLEYLPNIDPATADTIIFERESRPSGFTSIADLLDIPSISRRRLAQIYDVLTVRSNVYNVTCRGRDLNTGLEVEIVATIDRSTLPLTILEINVR